MYSIGVIKHADIFDQGYDFKYTLEKSLKNKTYKKISRRIYLKFNSRNCRKIEIVFIYLHLFASYFGTLNSFCI
jgi:hypothetical protein